MSNQEILQYLVAVHNSLNQIEVKGANNVMQLAGSLNVVGEVIAALQERIGDEDEATEKDNSE